jgi:hypothetical protein
MNNAKPTNAIEVLPKHQALKTCGGVEVQLYTLTLALDGSERSASRSGLITPEGTNFGRRTP